MWITLIFFQGLSKEISQRVVDNQNNTKDYGQSEKDYGRGFLQDE